MSELRATLGLLRGEHAPGSETEPQPTLGQIPELAARAGAAGLRVDVRIGTGATELPAVVELTAVRIVQESLTNIIRHAYATTAAIVIEADDRDLRIEVTDDGRGPQPTDHPGFGLRGMRERVESLGGTLRTGAGPDSGFQVVAVLPGGGAARE
jgi:signal transduction histidine kinase